MSRRQLMPEHKAKIRAAQLALWSNPEFKEAQRQKHLGYKHTEETKKKISAAKTGIKQSPETISKRVETRKSVVISFEARINISNAARKRRAKMTDEKREKLSIAISAYYMRKKAERKTSENI